MTHLFLSFVLGISNIACEGTQPASTVGNGVVTPTAKVTTKEILSGREIIWGMDFLPNGDLIFTEKKGKVCKFSKGEVTELAGFPTVDAKGQGGLLDVRVHPNYAKNGWIYASYSSSTGGGDAQWNLVRFKISKTEIKSLETLLTTSASNGWKGHYGSRIEFDKKGYLFVSVGEGGKTSRGGENSANQNAQTISEGWGKIHRLMDDGKIPTDNPILPGNTKPTSVYSYGHRNPQGLVLNTDTDEIWETEHGPKGGDELNKIQPNRNYGWPMVSYGVNYDGVTISEEPKRTGVEDPIKAWVPSIGACGLAYVSSDKYSGWKGSYLAGGLAKQYIARIKVENGKVVEEEKILENLGRIRNVKQGPDGFIYISLEGPGRIVQVVPE